MRIRSIASGRPQGGGWLALMAAMAVSALLAACGGSGSGSGSVPSLGSGSGSATAAGSGAGGAGSGRTAALHAAAVCIRQHGVPGYQDPVLTQGGQVYTDSRSFDDAGQAAITAIHNACRTELVRASLQPDSEPPAPPQLVEAGVRAAQCQRAHGLPHVTDPTATSPYTPGHGFGLTAAEVPSGGKASPGFQQAAHACRRLVDAEIRASTLSRVASGG